jgi:hypothetical protein
LAAGEVIDRNVAGSFPAEAAVTAAPPKKRGLRPRVAHAYRTYVDYRKEAALRTLVSFALMFALLRILTYGIHYKIFPIRDVVTGGLHIHHFVWGIGIVLVVGFMALSLAQARWHPWLAIPFGIGAALILDEFALWLNLKDVYWANQGRSSTDLVIVVTALLAVYVVAYRFWNEVGRELKEIVTRVED